MFSEKVGERVVPDRGATRGKETEVYRSERELPSRSQEGMWLVGQSPPRSKEGMGEVHQDFKKVCGLWGEVHQDLKTVWREVHQDLKDMWLSVLDPH